MTTSIADQFRELLEPHIARRGQTNVADAVGIPSHHLGRWRKRRGTLTLNELDALLGHFGLEVGVECRWGYPRLSADRRA